MKRIMILLSVPFLLASCGGSGTKKKPVVVAMDSIYDEAVALFKTLPENAAHTDYANTPEMVTLGKMLFFDTRLSLKGNNSCNSCHNLSTFGVDNKAVSEGDEGKNGERNSPTVFNAALHSMQFWDGRAKDVEEQAGMPILNPVEMNIPSEKFLVDRLSKVEEYKTLFAAAFPGDKSPLSYKNITKAIGAFERTLLTPSRFDTYLGGDKSALTKQEKDGLKVFIASGCVSCHNGALLGGTMMQKAGVYADFNKAAGSKGDDKGRMAVTKNPGDEYIFKVPSLRNITKTAPYFHDGSTTDLRKANDIMARVQLNKILTDKELDDLTAFMDALVGDIPDEAKKNPFL